MQFNETIRFPETIGSWAVGGPNFSVSITETEAGYEQRNLNFSQSRAKYSISGALTTKQIGGPLSWVHLNNFFQAHFSSLYGFRFKDVKDFQASTNSGCLGLGLGQGRPKYQLTKKYLVANLVHHRDIYKPVVGTVNVYKNNVLLTEGLNSGEYSVDYTTGVITFKPDFDKNVSNIITDGSIITLTTTANHNLVAGQTIYITDTLNTALNNRAFVILDTPTLKKLTIACTGAITSQTAIINFYNQQPLDYLTAEFEFDIPCRFDMPGLEAGADEGGLIGINQIQLVELRIKTSLI